ncbi:MAG: hypothetical protein IPL14_15660 [Nitrospira sp.]|nr:hypothetical protein [Nitrospira sp.]
MTAFEAPTRNTVKGIVSQSGASSREKRDLFEVDVAEDDYHEDSQQLPDEFGSVVQIGTVVPNAESQDDRRAH